MKREAQNPTGGLAVFFLVVDEGGVSGGLGGEAQPLAGEKKS